MTPWQTVFNHAWSSAETVTPESACSDERIAALVTQSKPAVIAPLLRRFVEQATVACRWLQQKSAQKFASRRMRVAETIALGEKRFVTILHVDGTQLLLGSAGGQISLLAVLDEDQTPRRAGATPEQSA